MFPHRQHGLPTAAPSSRSINQRHIYYGCATKSPSMLRVVPNIYVKYIV